MQLIEKWNEALLNIVLWQNKKTPVFIKGWAQGKLIGCEEDVVFGENVEKGVNC